MAKSVVIVESPAKAKTIAKYLGRDYEVIASFGHVRDLVPKDGSVKPEEDFRMVWEESEGSKKHLSKIVTEARKAEVLYLATDPDREGEAISWHVLESLKEKGVLKKDSLRVKRIMFHEVTKGAVLRALEEGRDVDEHLVDAYRARRALDYLIGYTLSPILWKKLPGVRSAGRVQSVALRLVSDREDEIEIFESVKYWSVWGELKIGGKKFRASLKKLDGKKVETFFFKSEEEAEDARLRVEGGKYVIVKREAKEVKRNPPPPFITSTLQQEASRKLRSNVSKTMRTAQTLYEGINLGGETVGLITYMRTDGTSLAQEAVVSVRKWIESTYGSEYVPGSPRMYKKKVKNAQEAHEAIRPTDVRRTPEKMMGYLNSEQQALYRLVWQRTVACQMSSALFEQTGVDLENEGGDVVLRAVGRVLKFDGYFLVYGKRDEEEDEDASLDDEDRRLPLMKEGDKPEMEKGVSEGHETKPPPRYSEASLVKMLESLGIGRPSTYAPTLTLLQTREYVSLEGGRFFPAFRGRLATLFLRYYFTRYVDYDFTANFEEILDDVAEGKRSWVAEMQVFWEEFERTASGASHLEPMEVMSNLDKLMSRVIYGTEDEGVIRKEKACPKCEAKGEDGELMLRMGRMGPFLSCSRYPECRHAKNLDESGHANLGEGDDYPRLLGRNEGGESVYMNRGPYGFYVQAGEIEADKKLVRRASFPKEWGDPEGCTLEKALNLLSLPRELGEEPERGDKVVVGLGRFGPYVRAGATYVSLTGEDSVFEIGINRAVTLISEKREKSGERVLGDHEGESVVLARSRFGYSLLHGGKRAYLPRGVDVETLSWDMVVATLASAKTKKPGTKKPGTKTPGTKKPGTKKPGTKSARKKA